MRYEIPKYANDNEEKKIKAGDAKSYKNNARKNFEVLVTGPEIQQFGPSEGIKSEEDADAALSEAAQSAGSKVNLARFINEAWNGEQLTFVTKTVVPSNITDTTEAEKWLKENLSKQTIAALYVEKEKAAGAVAQRDQITALLAKVQSGDMTLEEYAKASAAILGVKVG